MRSLCFGWFAILVVLGVIPVSVEAASGVPVRRAITVLLVGNSYTRFNQLPVLLQRLADSAPGPKIGVEAVTRGGYTLAMHLRRSPVRRRIESGRYSHVVLQGHSLQPVTRVAALEDSVARLHALIAASGAQTVLYETWARRAGSRLYRQRPDLAGPAQMQARVGGAYRRLSARYGAFIAPVGSAFLMATERHPELRLYLRDGAHPSVRGSYLAASVLYGAIAKADPRQATYCPPELPEVVARELRSLAAQVLQQEPSQPVSAAQAEGVARAEAP